MQSLVIDTNIVISAALSDEGKPAQIMKMVSDGECQLYCNTQIISEYTEVLSREKFNFSIDKQKAFTNKIEEIGVVVDPVPSVIPFADESDRVFYDTAKKAGAILITGNIKHYPTETFIMTPSDFLESLDSN